VTIVAKGRDRGLVAVGVYPGSFDPPTVAHLAVAEAARDRAGLDRVDLVVSRVALGKEHVAGPTAEERLEVLLAVAATRPWLGARLTDDRLIADVAAGYDAVIMGADKWAQVLDLAWYGGSVARRDEALARLPRVLVAPRRGHPITAADVAPGELLEVDDTHSVVSSTAVRAGRHDWMLPEAVAWARTRGAWGVGV
jgi:nicotinic acid mononucleotide adenylyltransferase